jgi:hypothetical protein
LARGFLQRERSRLLSGRKWRYNDGMFQFY